MTTAVSAIIYGIAGLATYLAATEGHRDQTLWTAAAVFAICLVLTSAGILAGKRFPRASAVFMRSWAVVVLVVGSGALAALTAVAVLVLTGRGGHPPPRTEKIAAVAATIIAGVGGLVTSGAGKLTPGWLSKEVIKRRYGRYFEAMPPQQPQLDGYYAVQRECFGTKDDGGPLAGWGLTSKRRLALIQKALSPPG